MSQYGFAITTQGAPSTGVTTAFGACGLICDCEARQLPKKHPQMVKATPGLINAQRIARDSSIGIFTESSVPQEGTLWASA